MYVYVHMYMYIIYIYANIFAYKLSFSGQCEVNDTMDSCYLRNMGP